VVNLIAMTLKFGDRTHIGRFTWPPASSGDPAGGCLDSLDVAARVANLPTEGEVMATSCRLPAERWLPIHLGDAADRRDAAAHALRLAGALRLPRRTRQR